MTKTKQKLAVIVLGQAASGKSRTWFDLFGKRINSGYKSLVLNSKTFDVYLKNTSFEETGQEIDLHVFVKNTSFEESQDEIENYFDENSLPNIIFCSVQYKEHGIKTINWFKDNGYYLYIQWLNPGYTHKKQYDDFRGFKKLFSSYGVFKKVSGKEKINRINDIRMFLIDFFK